MPYRIFISYAHSDGFLAQTIRTELIARGATVFLDQEELNFGDRFRERILPELTQANEIVALLTPTALTRVWVAAEIGIALYLGIRIVGIRYGVKEEVLREHGVLSLIGDVLHVYDTRDLPSYYEQVQRRSAAAEAAS